MTDADASTYWQKVGEIIVKHIQDNGAVMPGIEVSTSGGAGATTGVGKIK